MQWRCRQQFIQLFQVFDLILSALRAWSKSLPRASVSTSKTTRRFYAPTLQTSIEPLIYCLNYELVI